MSLNNLLKAFIVSGEPENGMEKMRRKRRRWTLNAFLKGKKSFSLERNQELIKVLKY
jgi:hypothetical protein